MTKRSAVLQLNQGNRRSVPIMSLSALVDPSKQSLFLSLGSITFNPIAWNIVARNGTSSSVCASYMYYSMTNPSGTCANKSTTTKQSLASLAGMLTWHVNSSPCAFSARGDYVTICTSPFFFFFRLPLSLPSLHPFFLTPNDLSTHAPT